MLKKFFYKRKRQEPKRHNTSKITMDAASIAILTRHFSPLSCRAKSPSDLLDIVGYPHSIVFSPVFQSATPAAITAPVAATAAAAGPITTAEESVRLPVAVPKQVRLTVRNALTPQEVILLETSREDKTLVEERDGMDEQLEALKQRLNQFEEEREGWRIKLRVYMQREEQLRKIIRENQARIKQLSNRYGYMSKSYYPDSYIYHQYQYGDHYYNPDQIAYPYPYYT
ncbi:uncharacterized protein EV154DRAFT_501791 [Mucor mucedo]|uniref:uncharacterized protein n=1 Tax=Mucor mucedo TaxID=29922 RepID=UPI002220BB6B|nr:uncharacterized protein EV154DRAFT_501791 [Mucor mucedo]KAI7893368.1 hypothetical protein EV154DRAFT_501791 [Mucor mucedo]